MDRFEKELDKIKNSVTFMGNLVEESIQNAIFSLLNRDDSYANKVVSLEQDINHLDCEIDEDCIKLIALKQPVASDLRLIITAMKTASDLERCGDLAVNIAERVRELNEEPPLKPYVDLPRMAETVKLMVRDALRAFFEKNVDLSLSVIKEDDVVDKLLNQINNELLLFMIKNPSTITRATKISFITKYLERIADHAVNIAESVIYLVEGKLVKHQCKQQKSDQNFD